MPVGEGAGRPGAGGCVADGWSAGGVPAGGDGSRGTAATEAVAPLGSRAGRSARRHRFMYELVRSLQ